VIKLAHGESNPVSARLELPVVHTQFHGKEGLVRPTLRAVPPGGRRTRPDREKKL
jgi:hypothetical protein